MTANNYDGWLTSNHKSGHFHQKHFFTLHAITKFFSSKELIIATVTLPLQNDVLMSTLLFHACHG